MQCASDSELDVAVIRIGFVDNLAIGGSTVKNNFLSFAEFDGRRDFFGADFAKEVFALFKRQIPGALLCKLFSPDCPLAQPRCPMLVYQRYRGRWFPH